MQLSARQTRAKEQLSILACVIRSGFPVVLRTDGRTEESDVITLQKFLALVGYQIFLPMRIRARAFNTRSFVINAIKISVNVVNVSVYQLQYVIKFIMF